MTSTGLCKIYMAWPTCRKSERRNRQCCVRHGIIPMTLTLNTRHSCDVLFERQTTTETMQLRFWRFLHNVPKINIRREVSTSVICSSVVCALFPYQNWHHSRLRCYRSALGLILVQITAIHSQSNMELRIYNYVCLFVEPCFFDERTMSDLEYIHWFCCCRPMQHTRECVKWRVYVPLWGTFFFWGCLLLRNLCTLC